MSEQRTCPACPGESWQVPENVGAWWAHVQSPEHEEQRRSTEGRANIDRFWAARDEEAALELNRAAGMLW